MRVGGFAEFSTEGKQNVDLTYMFLTKIEDVRNYVHGACINPRHSISEMKTILRIRNGNNRHKRCKHR